MSSQARMTLIWLPFSLNKPTLTTISLITVPSNLGSKILSPLGLTMPTLVWPLPLKQATNILLFYRQLWDLTTLPLLSQMTLRSSDWLPSSLCQCTRVFHLAWWLILSYTIAHKSNLHLKYFVDPKGMVIFYRGILSYLNELLKFDPFLTTRSIKRHMLQWCISYSHIWQ